VFVDKVRYAIIGCGGIARHYHLRELTNLPEAVFVACADIAVAKAKAMAKEFGARAHYDDHRTLLEHDDVDAVVVSTWHPTHSAIAADVLESGRHVLVQKPMTTNMADADRLVAAAVAGRTTGLKTYCFPFNWTGAFEKWKQPGTCFRSCSSRACATISSHSASARSCRTTR
jgi:predicted dehydrogenase